MVSWIGISGRKGMTNTRLIWLLFGICVVVFLVVVILPKKEKKDVVETKKLQDPVRAPAPEKPVIEEAAKKAIVPQKKTEALEEPEQESVEVPEVETLQARVTGIDPDMEMVMLDGQWYNSGSLDLSGIRIGNLVEVTYPKEKIARGLTLISSIRVLGLPEESGEGEEGFEQERAHRLRERLRERMEAGLQTEAEPLEERQKAGAGEPQVMEGRVTVIDPDLAVIVVDGVTFQAASYDPTGLQTPLFNLTWFQTGDVVRVTYTKEKRGNMAESIELIEPR
jgi:hypothetical protein